MNRKLVLGVLAVAVVIVGGYIALTTFTVSESQGEISDTADSTTVSTCQSTKQSMCATGSVSESDYPDSCFQNGEHVLDNPYQCSN